MLELNGSGCSAFACARRVTQLAKFEYQLLYVISRTHSCFFTKKNRILAIVQHSRFAVFQHPAVPDDTLYICRYAVRDEGRVWPVQQYRLASGRDAFLKGLAALHEDAEKRSKGWIERKLAPTFDPAREVSEA